MATKIAEQTRRVNRKGEQAEAVNDHLVKMQAVVKGIFRADGLIGIRHGRRHKDQRAKAVHEKGRAWSKFVAGSGLALFDFDGTVTVKDSMADFIQFAVGKTSYFLGLLKLSPVLLCYVLKIIPNYAAKERLLAAFFKGWDADYFQKIADEYATKRIARIIKPQAMEKIRWHQAQGDTVVIVTASMETWLKKWCERHGVDLIATQLEVQDRKITGRFATRNCYGMEKVNRIKERYNLPEFSMIYAYGDSRGDREMLEIATSKHYRKFN